ncbi:MAG: DUF3153 domain-containing protein [Cyanobacteriota bacterium]|nr:DUF3153 domain-containing protein [Cyanobacteriota bacterium]
MSTTPEHPLLAQAQQALERGDYGQVIRLLGADGAPVASGTPPAPLDPQALLLLATAQMGLGRSQEALLCCRRLRSCADAALRAQARELQRVLEAPSLQRPREWSLTLPDLSGSDPAMGRQLGELSRRRRQRPPAPPPPAVGPTRAPLGFALLVTLLVALTLLLGGCGTVHSTLQFSGAGRLQLSHRLDSGGAALPAWQSRWIDTLRQQGWQVRRRGESTLLQAPVLPSRQALERLQQSISSAAELAGVPLPPPHLRLRSRNWLVAVDERFVLELDLELEGLSSWAAPELGLILEGLPQRAVRSAAPAPVVAWNQSGDDAALRWPLQMGARNRLELHLWRWSPLGLGAVAVLALLLLSLALQSLRRQLGFGLSELPG